MGKTTNNPQELKTHQIFVSKLKFPHTLYTQLFQHCAEFNVLILLAFITNRLLNLNISHQSHLLPCLYFMGPPRKTGPCALTKLSLLNRRPLSGYEA